MQGNAQYLHVYETAELLAVERTAVFTVSSHKNSIFWNKPYEYAVMARRRRCTGFYPQQHHTRPLFTYCVHLKCAVLEPT